MNGLGNIIFATVLYLISLASCYANDTLYIVIVSDNEEAEEQHWFESLIKEEIEALLKSNVEIQFEEIYCAGNVSKIQSEIQRAFTNPEADILICASPISSSILALRDTFPIPSIAAVVLDRALQESPITPKGTSGKHNYTYVESPFDVNRDMKTLYRLRPFDKIAVVSNGVYEAYIPQFSSYFIKSAKALGAELVTVPLRQSVNETLSLIPDDVQATYFLPVDNGFNDSLIESTIAALHKEQIQTMAILGERYMNLGVLMAYEAKENLIRIPRRIALNVMKLFEGEDAMDLPVRITTFSENLLINLAACRASNIFPTWDLLNESYAVNYKEFESGNKINLQQAIANGLSENLEIKIAEVNQSIAGKDIKIARSDRLAQAEINTNFAVIDEQTASSAFGTRGRLNWIGGISVSQLIFAEPINANIRIQELLEEGRKYELKQAQLDVILDVADAYLNILQAKSFLEIQADNLNLTKENYDIAKAKENVGYGTASDLYRWESLLAQANSEFNSISAQYDQAIYSLNQLLNEPIGKNVSLEDVSAESNFLMVSDEKITDQISNFGAFQVFSDFMVEEAMRSLPELKQIDLNISIQRRLQKSFERALYLPSISASASLDRVVQKWGIPLGIDERDNTTSWTIGFGAVFPLFQGGKRKLDIEKGQLALEQLRLQKNDVSNQLELRVRSTLQQAATSYSNLDLTRTSSEAARKNFEIVQDSYSQGVVNITTLIDAQNASLQARLTATNAEYQFVFDFLALERSIGNFYFLMDPGEKEQFIIRYNNFMTSNQK